MAVIDRHETGTARGALGYLWIVAYALTALLGLSLLAVGAIAIIAQLKGTWHWMIHLESMVSYMSVFVGAILVVLVPMYAVLALARWRTDA